MRDIGLPQRQEIEQKPNEQVGIAADMSAVRQNLAIEFANQSCCAFALNASLTARTNAIFGKCDCGEEPIFARKSEFDLMFVKDFGPRQFAHEAAREDLIRAIEDHRRVREKGQQPARDDVRVEGRPAFAGMQQKITCNRTRIGVGERAVGGAEMAKPSRSL